MNIYVTLAAMAVAGTLLGGAYYKGHVDGERAEILRNAADTQKLNDEILRYQREATIREQDRLAEVLLLEGQIETLSEEANADPDADRTAVPTRSVQRINSVE